MILDGMKLKEEGGFTTIHNYIDIDAMILRKDAVSAKKGEQLLIPMNMRDGSLICTGLGNVEWNYSAPHGTGRLMSRKEAKDWVTLSEFRKAMDGTFTTTLSKDTLDEAPMVYKPSYRLTFDVGRWLFFIYCLWIQHNSSIYRK